MGTLWEEKDTALIREYTFPTFLDAISFINKVAAVAERLNHHPDIRNIYTKVVLVLSTHDPGDSVTDKDRTLAKEIDSLI